MYKKRYSFHRELGSMLYRIIYASLLYLLIKIFGADILLNNLVIFLLGIISFELVGIALRGIGLWR